MCLITPSVKDGLFFSRPNVILKTTMQIISIILSLIAVLVTVALIFLLRKNQRTDVGQEEGIRSLERELKEIRGELQGTFEKNLNFLQQSSGKSNEMIRDITSRLEQVLSTNKQVVSFAEQLQSLQNILRNPKHRGVLGEYFLEQLLSRILPIGFYKMQYTFRNGDIVDAAIFIKETVVPIDAKFSLEKYNQLVEAPDAARREELEKELKNDLKRRIDETSKYVKTAEGTTPYAIMYVPAEGILSSLNSVNYEDLISYAHSKKVIIAAPNTLLAYLHIALQAVKLIKFQESTKDVIKRIDDLGRHLLNYEGCLKKLGGHLGTVVSTYNQAYKEFAKIDKDVARLTEGEKSVEPMEIDKPSME